MLMLSLPGEVRGFGGLRIWLGLVDVRASAKSLCKRAERHGLPVRRDRSGVYFLPEDLRVWVHHLTGVDWDLWAADRNRARQRTQARQLGNPRKAQATAAPDSTWLLYGVLERRPDGEERLVHRPDGAALCGGARKRLERALVRTGADNRFLVRYTKARSAAASDFDPRGGTEHRLLAALYMFDGKLRWVRVRGHLSGIPLSVSAAVALAPVPSNIGDIRQAVQVERPGAMWITWYGRELLAAGGAGQSGEQPATGASISPPMVGGRHG